jgi:transcriptional regulator with GAF, ATPase, and Fis domain
VLHFIGQSARRLNRPVPRVTRSTMSQLAAHDWPGNVRELQTSSSARSSYPRAGPCSSTSSRRQDAGCRRSLPRLSRLSVR